MNAGVAFSLSLCCVCQPIICYESFERNFVRNEKNEEKTNKQIYLEIVRYERIHGTNATGFFSPLFVLLYTQIYRAAIRFIMLYVVPFTYVTQCTKNRII